MIKQCLNKEEGKITLKKKIGVTTVLFPCNLRGPHTRTHARAHTHSESQPHAIGATAGASDYAVKPNQLPVFGLMDAIIIFMDLNQVSLLQSPQTNTHSQTHKP